jgi:hypothetical protein
MSPQHPSISHQLEADSSAFEVKTKTECVPGKYRYVLQTADHEAQQQK